VSLAKSILGRQVVALVRLYGMRFGPHAILGDHVLAASFLWRLDVHSFHPISASPYSIMAMAILRFLNCDLSVLHDAFNPVGV
jgi:hypothetical protein